GRGLYLSAATNVANGRRWSRSRAALSAVHRGPLARSRSGLPRCRAVLLGPLGSVYRARGHLRATFLADRDRSPASAGHGRRRGLALRGSALRVAAHVRRRLSAQNAAALRPTVEEKIDRSEARHEGRRMPLRVFGMLVVLIANADARCAEELLAQISTPQ